MLSDTDIEAAIALVPEKLKADIQFAHENVRRLAEAQKATVEIFKTGVVPGGRYNQIASAIMTVTTAKVAVCNHIIACSPPRMGVGIAPRSFTQHIFAGPIKFLRWMGCKAWPL